MDNTEPKTVINLNACLSYAYMKPLLSIDDKTPISPQSNQTKASRQFITKWLLTTLLAITLFISYYSGNIY